MFQLLVLCKGGVRAGDHGEIFRNPRPTSCRGKSTSTSQTLAVDIEHRRLRWRLSLCLTLPWNSKYFDVAWEFCLTQGCSWEAIWQPGHEHWNIECTECTDCRNLRRMYGMFHICSTYALHVFHVSSLKHLHPPSISWNPEVPYCPSELCAVRSTFLLSSCLQAVFKLSWSKFSWSSSHVISGIWPPPPHSSHTRSIS